jgi:hypothetical protein
VPGGLVWASDPPESVSRIAAAETASAKAIARCFITNPRRLTTRSYVAAAAPIPIGGLGLIGSPFARRAIRTGLLVAARARVNASAPTRDRVWRVPILSGARRGESGNLSAAIERRTAATRVTCCSSENSMFGICLNTRGTVKPRNAPAGAHLIHRVIEPDGTIVS